MSPYVITTKRPQARIGCPASQEAVLERGEDCPLCERSAVAHASEEPFPVSRRAVATLEEARRSCVSRIAKCAFNAGTTEGYQPFEDAAKALPESGGTVGPLPDGTVIDVYETNTMALAGEMGWSSERALGASDPEIIGAYNARAVVA